MAWIVLMGAAAAAGYWFRGSSEGEDEERSRRLEERRRRLEMLQQQYWKGKREYSGRWCSLYTKLAVMLVPAVIAAGVVRYIHGPFLGYNLAAMVATFDWKIWIVLTIISVLCLLYLFSVIKDIVNISTSGNRLSDLKTQIECLQPSSQVGGVHANTVINILSPTFNSACFVSTTVLAFMAVVCFVWYILFFKI